MKKSTRFILGIALLIIPQTAAIDGGLTDPHNVGELVFWTLLWVAGMAIITLP